MKFTFPILTLCLGGAQRMLVELTNRLVENGHDVTIIMPPTGMVEYSIKGHLIRTSTPYVLNETDFPFSDIIVSTYYLVTNVSHAASLNGKGIHIRLSMCYEPSFLPDHHISFPTYHLTKHLIVISQWQKQIIFLNHGINAHVVPIGISSGFKNFNVRDTPNHALTILSILRSDENNWSWHRDQNYLITQLKMIKNRFPHVKINLVAPLEELKFSPKLQKIQLDKRFNIICAKNDEELCWYYNEADIFVSSSIYDAGSLPGLEALKCGAALVTTYSGGNMDYCRPEENCLMSFRYENMLGQNIIRLINDKNLRNKLSIEGEKEAQKWTWDRSFEAFYIAIVKVMNNG